MEKDESLDIYFYFIGWIVIALVIVFAIVISIFGTEILSIVPPCAFHAVTGYYCPGCGGTRAVFALARGEIIRSFKFHPLVLYSVVIGGWFMISQTICKITKGKVAIAMHFKTIYVWIALIILVLNLVIKNVLLINGIAMLGN